MSELTFSGLTFFHDKYRSGQKIFNGSESSIYVFGRLQKKFIENFNMGRNSAQSFKVCLVFPEKWLCIL